MNQMLMRPGGKGGGLGLARGGVKGSLGKNEVIK
jgi:hypothetical protein